MKTQYLVFPGKGRCDVVSAELPPVKENEIAVKNILSQVSAGTELSLFNRTHRGIDVPSFGWAKYPFKPGYAAVGEIIECGAGVKDFKAGDIVFHQGSHATVSVVDATGKVIRLPKGMTPDVGVFFALTEIAMTAPRVAPVGFGETVVVVGMGAVGNLAAQLCKRSGARRVAGADLSAKRLKNALDCGAIDMALNVKEKPLADQTAALGGGGAELIIEAVGASASIDSCLKAVAVGGRVVLLGSPRSNMEFDPYFDVHRKASHIIGGHGNGVSAAQRMRDREFIMAMLGDGRINVAPMITDRLAYSKAQSAYELLRDDPDNHITIMLTY